MIARARKELLPLRLVKALHAADSLGLVDRTPLGIWLPWHVLLPFNVEERKTPAITLLMRLYRAELGMESPVQQSAAGPERPPDPSNVVLDHISSSPQKDNRNTSEFFKAADVELEGWISGFNVGYRPLESGQVSVDAGVTGNPVDMDVTEAFRRAWFQVFVRNAHNRNNYLVPALYQAVQRGEIWDQNIAHMIERLYEEDVESRTQQMNHSRLYPEEGSQDVGTLEDLDGVLAEAPPPSDGLGDVPIMDEEFSPLPTADHGTYTSSNNHTVGVELEYPGTQEVSDGPAADSNTGVAPQDIADLHGFITELLHEPEETSNIGNDTQGSVQEKVMDPQRDSASDSDPSTPKRSQHLDAPNGPVGVISIKQTAGDDLSPALGEAASSVNRIAF
ncbi:hypothetical protein PUNSTDRAFT_125141 [Punctularia strigosozonata HHB-11173 SS5]|uniref:uncharacterized protein n=1 Tax=Punctularia strigosozonata (strain HHB-11173) TaxID=741275 RepID=UPI0004417C36|nr:uncharacterized protein PUNSTDRAFT_125141 [Punctularia strigosozonata HHB-11173 SS5]EIN10139.1 hypothetical protein PUNSTDRAFT_125141 [Punctularia strigosozonata HHB-11173 SS5]